MSTGCIDCVRKENQLELKERDLRELREERDYYHQQAQQAQQQLQALNARMGELEKAAGAERHTTVESLLRCPTCGPRALEDLPRVLSKEAARRVTEAHFPGAFKPITIPGG